MQNSREVNRAENKLFCTFLYTLGLCPPPVEQYISPELSVCEKLVLLLSH